MVFVAAPNSSEKEVYDLLFSWETQHVGSQEEHSSLPLSVLASLGVSYQWPIAVKCIEQKIPEINSGFQYLFIVHCQYLFIIILLISLCINFLVNLDHRDARQSSIHTQDLAQCIVSGMTKRHWNVACGCGCGGTVLGFKFIKVFLKEGWDNNPKTNDLYTCNIPTETQNHAQQKERHQS